MEQLKGSKAQPVESPNLLPPLTPADVFGLLDPPAELEEFGDRLTAEPGKTYVHQVVRAIHGYVLAGKRGEPWEPKLSALTRPGNTEVRREAYLAHTHRGFKPLPAADLLEVIDAPAEPATVREAATLSFSYHDHPAVFAKLHHLAGNRHHPAWSAAVSRLGDLGDGFTEGHLDKLEKLTPEQAKLVADSADRIAQRMVAEAARIAKVDEDSVQTARGVLIARLQHAAWIDLRSDPLRSRALCSTV